MQARQIFLRHIAQTSPAPLLLEIERAEGCYLYDVNQKPYLDLIAGIGVSCLGHGHPAIKAALHTQVEKHLHTLVYGEFVLSPQVTFASLLTANLPDTLDTVYLVNSGAEATEGAMKLAKRITGRPNFVACHKAYHGSTQGALSLMSDTYFTNAYRPLLPGIQHINYNNFEDLAHITTQTAAVVMETVQAESGITPPAAGYLQAVAARCKEVGALLILDEAQCAFGRTGSLFAFAQYDIVPDILLLAKGMGGGMPLGAFVSSHAHMQAFTHDPVLGHITTFGGHPMSCAAAIATLRTLLHEPFMAEVSAKEARLIEKLQHPAIKAVRHAGLWLAVELTDNATLQRVIAACLQKGLITDWFLFNDYSLRIAPPLTISMAEIDWACSVICDVLTDVT
jgi:acetylornithine/N-succinyldiaminopimelate aminotransferase